MPQSKAKTPSMAFGSNDLSFFIVEMHSKLFQLGPRDASNSVERFLKSAEVLTCTGNCFRSLFHTDLGFKKLLQFAWKMV